MSKFWLIIAIAGLAGSLVLGCAPEYPKCDKDDHCREGEYCVNNLCQQCRDNGDCPEGQACEGGGCREIPDYCTGSADCAEGQVCRDNRCGPCFSDGECQSPEVCIDGVCDEADCATTEDCPAGTSCVNRRCQTDTSGGDQLGDADCTVEEVYFEFDSSELTNGMRRVIENNYDCLKGRVDRLTLVGHCDSRGTTEYNMALGERRARMVSKVVKTLGMESSRLRVISKGKEEATGTDEASWGRDRRVEFK
jgi:peptidoglycan-associated lipoprotein